MEIRIAIIDDIDNMMDIRLEMLRVVNHMDADEPFSNQLLECSKDYFLNGNQTTCLAFDKDKVIGCASISYIAVMPTFSHPTGKRAHLMNVYTNKNYQRQGIAKQMVELLIDDAKEKHVTEISLDATDEGRPLYEKLGFKVSEECMVMSL